MWKNNGWVFVHLIALNEQVKNFKKCVCFIVSDIKLTFC